MISLSSVILARCRSSHFLLADKRILILAYAKAQSDWKRWRDDRRLFRGRAWRRDARLHCIDDGTFYAIAENRTKPRRT